jgi:tetratricopeptide (TPR) repeat protein
LRATATALRLNAGCQPAWVWQGVVLYHLGMQDEARASLMASLASNPNDPFALGFLGQTFFEDRDYDRAIAFTDRALAIDRGGLYGNLFRPMMPIYRGQSQEAERCIREARSAIGNDPMLIGYEALLHAKEDRAAKARAAIKRALTGKSLVHGHHTQHLVAAAYAVLGDAAPSVAALRKAAHTGFPNYAGFRDDPHFKSLHRYSPFLRFMAELKRESARNRRQFSPSVMPS